MKAFAFFVLYSLACGLTSSCQVIEVSAKETRARLIAMRVVEYVQAQALVNETEPALAMSPLEDWRLAEQAVATELIAMEYFVQERSGDSSAPTLHLGSAYQNAVSNPVSEDMLRMWPIDDQRPVDGQFYFALESVGDGGWTIQFYAVEGVGDPRVVRLDYLASGCFR